MLVALPKDFGWYGPGEGEDEGRYAAWRDAASHERFRADLGRMIDMVLAGKRESLREEMAARPDAGPLAPAALPEFALTALDGSVLDREAVAGKVVLVEFWATWCPPCRGTLDWLGTIRRRHGDRVEVLAVAVDSDEADVRRLADELEPSVRWAMGSPELVRRFGDISAVPTLFLFDASGRAREVWLGAPPDLHHRAEAALAELLTDD